MQFKRCLAIPVVLCFGLMAGRVAAQGFDDNFYDNPLDSGEWVINGNAQWIPSADESVRCADDNGDPSLDVNATPGFPCTLYGEDEIDALGLDAEEFGGYILATPALGGQNGNAFRAESDNYDNFKMEVVVELRDGSINRPADGMTVTIVGGDLPPNGTGFGGGGMGAPCVGVDDFAPQMVFEFDNWSGNVGDNNNDNHVGFAYWPNGTGCADVVPLDVMVPIDPAVADLHNQQAPPAEPNRYKMTVYVQGCGDNAVVAMDLEALDFNGGVNLGRIFTHTVTDFIPFEGYLGVTGSTGGAWQNHILHSASLEILPDGFCLQPAAEVVREIVGERTVEENCGDFLGGDVLDVRLTLANVRVGNDCCDDAGEITLTDIPPDGWDVSGISDGGTFEGGVITWIVDAPMDGMEFTYQVTADDPPEGSTRVSWGGGGVTEGDQATVLAGGATSVSVDTPFDDCGGVLCWNLVGPIMQPGGAGPGEDLMRMDYLADGAVTELDFVFEPGEEITPDFFGASAGQGIAPDANNRNPNAVDGTLTVVPWNDAGGFINLNDDVYGADPDNVMGYAQLYIESDDDIDAFLETSSDDSIQVILNEAEVHAISVPRGAGVDSCAVQQDVGIPIQLVEGENRLIVKVFEGGGGWNFTLRIVDELGEPIIEGLRGSKLPFETPVPPPARFTRTFDITDTVRIGAAERKVWTEAGQVINATIDIADVREVELPIGEITVVETVPADWAAMDASHDGDINDNTITWIVDIGAVSSLTYTVETGAIFQNVTFDGVVSEAGNSRRVAVGGDTLLAFAPPRRCAGDSELAIEEDFEGGDGCPLGFTCNGGGVGLRPFQPGVVDGRLRLSNESGNIGTTVILNDLIDVSATGFTAEFDVYMSYAGAADPADGITFMILDADDPINPGAPDSLGVTGGGLGYQGLTGLAVELDLWDGGANDPSGFNNVDERYGHVAVVQDGIVMPHVQTMIDYDPDLRPEANGGTGWPEFVDFAGTGLPMHVEVTYNGGYVQVFLEADGFERTQVIDTVVTFAREEGVLPVLENVYVGFSAGTGGAFCTQEVDDFTLSLFETEECGGGGDGITFLRGDCNGDGNVIGQVGDAIFVLNYNFLGGPAPECMAACDSNADGNVIGQVGDAIYTLNYNFLGGPAIPEPFPACGRSSDERDLALGCEVQSCP